MKLGLVSYHIQKSTQKRIQFKITTELTVRFDCYTWQYNTTCRKHKGKVTLSHWSGHTFCCCCCCLGGTNTKAQITRAKEQNQTGLHQINESQHSKESNSWSEDSSCGTGRCIILKLFTWSHTNIQNTYGTEPTFNVQQDMNRHFSKANTEPPSKCMERCLTLLVTSVTPRKYKWNRHEKPPKAIRMAVRRMAQENKCW